MHNTLDMDLFKDFDSNFDDLLRSDDDNKGISSYNSIFYHSPTYSTDSGIEVFLPELNDFMPVVDDRENLEPVLKDEDFSIRCVQSPQRLNSKESSSTSTELDHSYSRYSVYSLDNTIDIENLSSNISCKERGEDNSKPEEVVSQKLTKPLTVRQNKNVKADEKVDKFSYIDENGKVVVVEKSQKNAEMAKLNRKRKKRYVANLEAEIKSLRSINDKLMANKSNSDRKIESLQVQLKYLKSVIANQTMLSSLVQTVSNVPGVNLSCNLDTMDVSLNKTPSSAKKQKVIERLPGKRGPPVYDDSDYSGGVCLHVSQNKVSLEFCPQWIFINLIPSYT